MNSVQMFGNSVRFRLAENFSKWIFLAIEDNRYVVWKVHTIN